MFVRINGVIAAIDERHLEVDKRIASDRAAGSGLDDAFFDRRAEILRHGTAKDLINPLKTSTPIEGFKYYLAIAKLPAAARLFLVPTLDLGGLRYRFLVRYLWRMQCDLDVI